VWSTVDGADLGVLEGHTATVNVVAVAADGTVFSRSLDGTLRAWSGLDGSPLQELQMSGVVRTIAIGPGNTVIIGVSTKLITWNGGAAPAHSTRSCLTSMRWRLAKPGACLSRAMVRTSTSCRLLHI
jgi:WD40 repeat protein